MQSGTAACARERMPGLVTTNELSSQLHRRLCRPKRSASLRTESLVALGAQLQMTVEIKRCFF